MERVLEGLVERVEQTVRETPHEEERRDEGEAEVDLALAEVISGDSTFSGVGLRLQASHVAIDR